MIKHYDLFHHIESIFDARIAIEQIENNGSDDDKLPDIIFLDLFMPDFDGFDFLERFKKLCNRINKTIDIFVITSSIDPVFLTKAKTFDFVKDVLIKPVKSDVLADIYSKYKQAYSIEYR